MVRLDGHLKLRVPPNASNPTQIFDIFAIVGNGLARVVLTLNIFTFWFNSMNTEVIFS